MLPWAPGVASAMAAGALRWSTTGARRPSGRCGLSARRRGALVGAGGRPRGPRPQQPSWRSRCG
eukprot:1699724-Alexandrium_andersonii.AAC.1